MIKRYIEIKHSFEGFHAYKDAPDEVSFLRQRHRHMFHVTAVVETTHNDRELEFFIEQRFLKSLFSNTQECNNKSCEMICEDVVEEMNRRYNSKRYLRIKVSEDEENAGIVEYIPEL